MTNDPVRHALALRSADRPETLAVKEGTPLECHIDGRYLIFLVDPAVLGVDVGERIRPSAC